MKVKVGPKEAAKAAFVIRRNKTFETQKEPREL